MPTAVPSGAVSGATPSGGVVQGIFISESMNNGRVPKEDVEAAIKMLEGAYQSHIDEMEKITKAKSNGYPRKKGQSPLYVWQLRFLRPEIKTELAKYVNI